MVMLGIYLGRVKVTDTVSNSDRVNFYAIVKQLAEIFFDIGLISVCFYVAHIVRFGTDLSNQLVNLFSKGLSLFQSGYLYHYAFAMLGGLVIILTWFMYY